MRTRWIIAWLTTCLLAAAAHAQSTPLTFQGQLLQAGVPANGNFDLRFTLYDALTGGTAVSAPACADDVVIANGQCTVVLPFTLPASGVDTYIEVQVRSNAALPCSDSTGFTTLSPRQRVSPAPAAVFASAVPQAVPVIAGAIRFNATTKKFEGYDGFYWAPFTMGQTIDPASTQLFTTAGTQSFVVPAGVTRLGVDIWGAGGAGGARTSSGNVATSCTSTGPYRGGGGGGGSGTYARAFLDVTPGETLTIFVGPGGSTTTTNGQAGQASYIGRGAAIILRSYGGAGGHAGLVHNSIPSDVYCPIVPSGAGGNGGAPPQLFASGDLIANYPGYDGGDGSGPGCQTSSPGPLCPGHGGGASGGATSVAPLSGMSAGAGGIGQDPTGTPAAAAGGTGGVRLFWN